MADDIQTQLRQAIAAARSGDRATAMRLLQRVIEQDSSNETAWMWLASTATSTTDKRRYLQRVLSINPQNQTARAALERLGGSVPSSAPPPSSVRATGGRRNLITIGIFAAGFLAVVVITITIIRAVSQAGQPTADDLTRVAVAAQDTQQAASPIPTTPAVTARPSRTPTLVGVLVTPQPATLPATFTPTPEPTATDTPIPSPTPPPLSSYTLFFGSVGTGDELPVLNRINGAGEESTTFEIAASELAISPDGQMVAFVAPADDVDAAIPLPTATPSITPTPPSLAATEEVVVIEEELEPIELVTQPQADNTVAVFVASLQNPTEAQQLTTVRTEDISGLSWSVDGEQVVYVRDGIFIEGVTLNGVVTTYAEPDDEQPVLRSGPVFAPDGERIVFASDRDSPGLLEIYALDVASGAIERLTDDAGISFDPAFSPDGTLIAFVSDRNGDPDIFVMEADGSAPRLITQDDDGAIDRSPAFSPDGRQIAFSSNRAGGNFQLFLVDRQTLSIERVTDTDQNDQNPSFLP